MISIYLHGLVDRVLSIVVVVLGLLENSSSRIKLNLDLGGQGAFEVDDPQRLFFADGNADNLQFRLMEFIICKFVDIFINGASKELE